MNPELLILIILIVVAGIFFIWGTVITSVKHIGVGGILLSLAIILLTLYKIR